MYIYGFKIMYQTLTLYFPSKHNYYLLRIIKFDFMKGPFSILFLYEHAMIDVTKKMLNDYPKKFIFLINNNLFRTSFLKYDKYKHSILWMLKLYISKYWSIVKKCKYSNDKEIDVFETLSLQKHDLLYPLSFWRKIQRNSKFEKLSNKMYSSNQRWNLVANKSY